MPRPAPLSGPAPRQSLHARGLPRRALRPRAPPEAGSLSSPEGETFRPGAGTPRRAAPLRVPSRLRRPTRRQVRSIPPPARGKLNLAVRSRRPLRGRRVLAPSNLRGSPPFARDGLRSIRDRRASGPGSQSPAGVSRSRVRLSRRLVWVGRCLVRLSRRPVWVGRCLVRLSRLLVQGKHCPRGLRSVRTRRALRRLGRRRRLRRRPLLKVPVINRPSDTASPTSRVSNSRVRRASRISKVRRASQGSLRRLLRLHRVLRARARQASPGSRALQASRGTRVPQGGRDSLRRPAHNRDSPCKPGSGSPRSLELRPPKARWREGRSLGREPTTPTTARG